MIFAINLLFRKLLFYCLLFQAEFYNGNSWSRRNIAGLTENKIYIWRLEVRGDITSSFAEHKTSAERGGPGCLVTVRREGRLDILCVVRCRGESDVTADWRSH